MVAVPPNSSADSLEALSVEALATETGVLKALVTIRNAPLPGEDKAALRDLFLDYAGEANPARRESLKQEIIKRLPKKEETTPKESLVSAVPTSFGRARRTPEFSVTEKVKVAVKTAVPPPEPLPEPEKIKPEVKVSVPEPVTPATSSAGVNAKGRIDEIKHDINVRFGNPVNLISRDETVGREYMAALLDAMKKSSAGEVPAREALARLETAYAAANQVSTEGPIKPAAEVKPAARAPEPKSPVPEIKSRIVIPPMPSTARVVANESKLLPQSRRDAGPVTQVKPATALKRVTVISSASKAAPPQQKTILSPVSSATTLPEEMNKLRENAAKREAEDKKPITDLKADKVTLGLKQLLAEWKLFKPSGWFGTGPSGIDHPLYQQLRNLPMAGVISGRFEGATPEVKQSITDYMNGWRYEQAVVHEMEESFEHYLRRVIMHILERPHDPLAPKKDV